MCERETGRYNIKTSPKPSMKNRKHSVTYLCRIEARSIPFSAVTTRLAPLEAPGYCRCCCSSSSSGWKGRTEKGNVSYCVVFFRLTRDENRHLWFLKSTRKKRKGHKRRGRKKGSKRTKTFSIRKTHARPNRNNDDTSHYNYKVNQSASANLNKQKEKGIVTRFLTSRAASWTCELRPKCAI
mgnify:CR=1 FL=1